MTPQDRATLEALAESARAAGEALDRVGSAFVAVADALATARKSTQDDYTLMGPGK